MVRRWRAMAGPVPEPPGRRRPARGAPAARKPPSRAAPAKRAAAKRVPAKRSATKPPPSKPAASRRDEAGAGTRPASRSAGGGRASDRVRRRRAALKLCLVGLVLVGLLFVFIYPTRTFIQQRNQTNAAEQRLRLLRSETSRLENEAKKLNDPGEVERVARERYGLIRPGETPYVVVPVPSTTVPATTAPTTAPPGGEKRATRP